MSLQMTAGITVLRLACVAALVAGGAGPGTQSCGVTDLAVQILGSGGPVTGPNRASSSYLVWFAGHGRVLVDVGGGSFLRYGQAGARLDDLWLVAITHLHPDHVSDLPAVLWLSDALRKEHLKIVGPSGNDAVPSFPTFLHRLFDDKDGAFPMLGGTLGRSGRGVPLDVAVVDVGKPEPSMVLNSEGVTVTAVGVPHGNLPSLAYRVHVKNSSIVFGSDQTGTDPRFIELARGADVLVMHLASAAGERSPAHASPADVGRIAREARVGHLVLSHLGPGVARESGALQPEFDLEPAVADVKNYYKGPVTVGADLQCTSVR
jgi:ribonuclease BN (tRNA processing enzyme)